MANFYKSYKGAMDGHNEFSMSISKLGAPTNPMHAKQLEEFNKLANQGIKNIEIGTISADKFEFIPTQHFDEVRRLAKITDSKVSVHGPLIDLAGFPSEGRGVWTQDQRKASEEQLYSILQRSFQLSNGENVPVVFHAGHFQSQEFEKNKLRTVFDKEGEIVMEDAKRGIPKTEKERMGVRSIVAVNQDTGEVRPLEWDTKNIIEEDGQVHEEIYDPMRKLRSLNHTFWDQEKLKVQTRQKTIEELKERLSGKLKQNESIEKTGLIDNPEYIHTHQQNERDINWLNSHINNESSNLRSEYQDLYDRFSKFASEEQKKDFMKVIQNTQKNLKDLKNDQKKIKDESKELNEKRNEIAKKLNETSNEEETQELKQSFHRVNELLNRKQMEYFNIETEKAKEMVNTLGNTEPPKLWRAVGEFAIEKSAETVGNALSRLYLNLKKEGKEKQTPFIALENFFVNSPMSTAEELKKAVKKSREVLEKNLIKDGINEIEAKKASEILVGATWDVGHINNLRKAGFEGEELKQLVLEETSKIAELTRHVHVTDNFGFHDSHLPPGMGNVPIREIMEKLEKTWAKLEKEGKLPQSPRSIVEAGGFVAEIGQNPTLAILEYFGSPLYNMPNSPYSWGPNVSNVGHTYTPYNESFIEFPQQHFSLYSSSFTTLPKSVGGQVGGEQSRLSGTPNQ